MRYALAVVFMSALLPPVHAQDYEAEKLFRDIKKGGRERLGQTPHSGR